MKVTVFGATGGTGQHVVKKAIEKGHQVVAFTRSPDKLKIKDENLTVFAGDVLDEEIVTEAINGADAVISTLAPVDNSPKFVVSAGTKNILAGMKQNGVSRLVVTSGAGVGDPKDAPKFVNKLINFLLRMTAKNVFADMQNTTEIVRQSDLDWTIVRVPMLADDPQTGVLKVGWVGKGVGVRIGRADLASFLLDQLEDETYLRQSPVVSN
jgi:putative NADH-flavin reductase